MDSKRDNGSREMLVKLQEKIEKAASELKTSGLSSASTSSHLKNLSKEIQLLFMKTAYAQPQISDELDKVFDAEEVGHSCHLCQRDLASDPERLNDASLRSLQESCVLTCGHVYHFKCLRGTTTLDLDYPSCIFCINYSN